MADFVESNSLIATDEVGLVTTSPPVRGSAEWLAALSETVTHELSDSLAQQEMAKRAGDVALLELDAVVKKMRSHTRPSQGVQCREAQVTRSQGYGPASVFKPSALSAYGLKPTAETLRSDASDALASDVPVSVDDSVRRSWPANWSVLRTP